MRLRNSTMPWWVVTLLLTIGLVTGAWAATLPGKLSMFPLIVNGQAQARATITTLVESDSTFVSAAIHAPTQRRFVSYIARANGNRLHITEDCGNRLEELDLPPELLGSLALQPAFTFTGDKQADSAMVITGNTIRVWVSSRDATTEGNSDGPFKLKRLDIPVPPSTCA